MLIVTEIKKKDFKTMQKLYEKEKKDKNFKPYKNGTNLENRIKKTSIFYQWKDIILKSVEEKWQKLWGEEKSFSTKVR